MSFLQLVTLPFDVKLAFLVLKSSAGERVPFLLKSKYGNVKGDAISSKQRD